MKVWVIRNKRKEFRYFDFYHKPELSYKGNNSYGHYERTDTWPSDIDYDCRSYEFIEDKPPIPYGTWFVRLPSGDVDYGIRLPINKVPPIRRKIMNHKSEPILLDI